MWVSSFQVLGIAKRAGPTIAAVGGVGGGGGLPLAQLMLETDAPFMTVDKAWFQTEGQVGTVGGMGGRKNEPAAMPAVCWAVAVALGASPEAVAIASTANATRFFGLANVAGGQGSGGGRQR